MDDFDELTMDGANMIIRSIIGLGKPVVAGVNGVAAGVGASICFAADLAVANARPCSCWPSPGSG